MFPYLIFLFCYHYFLTLLTQGYISHNVTAQVIPNNWTNMTFLQVSGRQPFDRIENLDLSIAQLCTAKDLFWHHWNFSTIYLICWIDNIFTKLKNWKAQKDVLCSFPPTLGFLLLIFLPIYCFKVILKSR